MARRRNGRIGRRLRQPGRVPLLDLTSQVVGTYTRGNANTRFLSSVSDVSLVRVTANVKRSDNRYGGSFYISEQGRNNIALWSEDFTNVVWVKTNCTATANTDTAPDGTTTANQLVTTASGVATTCTQPITAAGNQAFFIFAKRKTTSQICSITLSDGVTTVNQDFSLTSTWQWVRIRGTGILSPYNIIVRPHAAAGTGVANDDMLIWGAMAQQSTVFGTYKTATSGTGFGGEDQLAIASGSWPTRMATQPWEFAIWPNGNNTELNLTSALWSFGGANDEVQLLNTDAIRIVAGGVTILTTGVLTWDRDTSRINIAMYPSTGTVVISGATSGNGTTVGAAWTWPTGVTLTVGRRNGVANTAPFCRIENPYPL